MVIGRMQESEEETEVHIPTKGRSILRNIQYVILTNWDYFIPCRSQFLCWGCENNFVGLKYSKTYS